MHLNENQLILPGEASDPSVEHAVDIVVAAELIDAMDDVGDGPVLLERVGLDAEAVVLGDVSLPEAADLGGEGVSGGVVVDGDVLLLFEGS